MGRVVLAVLSLALLATAVGCGAKHVVSSGPNHKGSPDDFAYVRSAVGAGSWVHVSVVDGDQDRPVRGAFVRIGKHARVSDHAGVAKIHLKHRSALVVH